MGALADLFALDTTERASGDAGGAALITHWQILTGEYPPQPGGVSDYTRVVARALVKAGDCVDVWAPPLDGRDDLDPGISVRRLPDRFGHRSRRLLDRELDALRTPWRLLVQYVPHAFGWKAANVPFCLWLYSRRRDPIWIMFHEVTYPIGAGHRASENALGLATRGMAALAGRAADRIFVSIPAWEPVLDSLGCASAPIEWLPVPSSVSDVHDAEGAARLRRAIAPDSPLVGHLGTYGRLIRSQLDSWLPPLLSTTNIHLLLLGRHGDRFRADLLARFPSWAGRISASGGLSAEALSRHIGACDLMIQPYPDGVSSRRTSVMVALSHGRPVVTTAGQLTEPFWADCGAVLQGPADDPVATAALTASLVSNPARLCAMSTRARSLYAERFDVCHTVERLRSGNAVGRSRIAAQ